MPRLLPPSRPAARALTLIAAAAFGAAAAGAQPVDRAQLDVEEARFCALAENPNTTVEDLAEAQAQVDAALLLATAEVMEAELERLVLGAGILIAAANAFVENEPSAVEMARIALGGTTYTLATVLALKSGEIEQSRAILASGNASLQQLEDANALAVELYISVSLHGATLVSAAGLNSDAGSHFPGLDDILLFMADVPSLLSEAPDVSAIVEQLGAEVGAEVARNNGERLDALVAVETIALPSLRETLAAVQGFHDRASECIAPTMR